MSHLKLFLLGLSSLLCNNKGNVGENEPVNCMKHDVEAFEEVTFNEKWIAENKVKKIVERVYTTEGDGKYLIASVRVLSYNENGYIVSQYENRYPKDTLIPRENDVKSKTNYLYEKLGSILAQHTEGISYYDIEDSKLPKPDTIRRDFTKKYRLKSTNPNYKEYKIIARYPYKNPEHYKYDDKDRLIKVGDAEIKYLDDNIIRIKKDLNPGGAMSRIGFIYIETNENGQITERRVQHFLRSKHATVFKYNESGEMIRKEFVEFVNGQEIRVADSRYTTYTYHK